MKTIALCRDAFLLCLILLSSLVSGLIPLLGILLTPLLLLLAKISSCKKLLFFSLTFIFIRLYLSLGHYAFFIHLYDAVVLLFWLLITNWLKPILKGLHLMLFCYYMSNIYIFVYLSILLANTLWFNLSLSSSILVFFLPFVLSHLLLLWYITKAIDIIITTLVNRLNSIAK